MLKKIKIKSEYFSYSLNKIVVKSNKKFRNNHWGESFYFLYLVNPTILATSIEVI